MVGVLLVVSPRGHSDFDVLGFFFFFFFRLLVLPVAPFSFCRLVLIWSFLGFYSGLVAPEETVAL